MIASTSRTTRAVALVAGLLAAASGCASPPPKPHHPAPPELSVWYGLDQQVGRPGHAQADFNLLGRVRDPDGVAALTYRLNDAAPETLSIGRGRFGDGRRLGAPGDGQGNFTVSILSRGIGNHESRLADLDGDGDLDVLTKPYTWDAPRVDVWLNQGPPPRSGAEND